MTLLDIQSESRKRGVKPRILVTRLRYLGDVVISTSLLELLSEIYPEVELYYLTERPYAPVLESNPHLKGVISVGDGLTDIFTVVRKLRGMRITAVIDLFYNPKSAWISWFSGAPVRIGGSRKWRKKFYTYNYSAPAGTKSAILHHVYSLGPLGIEPEERMPRIYLTEEEIWKGRKEVERLTGRSERFIAIHPGGKWQAKRWKRTNFVELIHLIKRELGFDAIILSGPGEEEISRDIHNRTAGESYWLPVSPIRKVASVIASCDALVAADGGVMHLSVALEKPTVGILGPMDPEVWFPYEGRGPYKCVYLNKPCSPCNRHFCDDRSCMDDIAPSRVLESLRSVLDAKNGSQG